MIDGSLVCVPIFLSTMIRDEIGNCFRSMLYNGEGGVAEVDGEWSYDGSGRVVSLQCRPKHDGVMK